MCSKADDPTQHDKRECATKGCQREPVDTHNGTVHAYCGECERTVLSAAYGAQGKMPKGYKYHQQIIGSVDTGRMIGHDGVVLSVDEKG